VVGSWLGYLFSMVSENGISYFVIISNLFMAVKFFMPPSPKRRISLRLRSGRPGARP